MSKDATHICRAIRSRLRQIPFRLGWRSIVPGTYLAYVPDRYSDLYHRYRQSAGALDRGAVRKFYRGNGMNNRGDLPRYYFLWLVLDRIVKEGLKGDIAELGVYKGNTAFLLAEIARRTGGTCYLLDTFEGFSGGDLSGVDADKRRGVQFGDTSLNAVRSLVGEEGVRFVAGHFPETAAQIPDDARFSLVHLDCDLYAPFAAALRFFYPRLVAGGFLIMHDYSSLIWDGVAQAVDEFLADKPEKIIPIPDKSGTAVVRKL